MKPNEGISIRFKVLNLDNKVYVERESLISLLKEMKGMVRPNLDLLIRFFETLEKEENPTDPIRPKIKLTE